jgi:FolB domain-containing protein
MDKVFIKDLRVRTILGVLEWERETAQDVLINVVVFTKTRPASSKDDLSVCVDYAILTKEIRDLVEKSRRYTVEALAEDIAQLCLSSQGVKQVTVRVEKIGAVTSAASVGIEIERKNAA